jgi:hypothetical protein
VPTVPTDGDLRRKLVLTTCPSHRHRAASPVRSPEEALTTLALATDAGRDTCVVIGGLDRRRRPLALLVVDEASGSDLPLAVDIVISAVRELGSDSPVAAVFLACSGGAAIAEPGDAECTVFAELEHRLAGAGIALLDWFMLSDGSAISVPHRAGRVSAW